MAKMQFFLVISFFDFLFLFGFQVENSPAFLLYIANLRTKDLFVPDILLPYLHSFPATFKTFAGYLILLQ